MIIDAISDMLPGHQAADTNPNKDPLSNFWYGPVGQTTPSGIDVTPDNAMRVSAVNGCVRILCEAVGHLPFQTMERTGETSKKKATDNYLWGVLHDRPNRWQTAMTWKEMAVLHLMLRGNFYCQIRGYGEGMELWPLNPDRVTVKQTPSGELVYTYRNKLGEPIEYQQEDIYHVMMRSLNGITGVGPIEFARNTIGSTIAQETHGASLFKNGNIPPFWIYRPTDRKWTKEAQKNFRSGWRQMHGGSENAGNPPIMNDGMELRELKINNRDSQWLESRGLSAEEICRFFGIAPHMIGVKSTNPKGDTEQKALEFLMYTLTPLVSRFEQAADVSLVSEPDKYYTKFNLDALRRGDTLSRHTAHNIAVQGGWKTINEVRKLEDLNPIEGGDEALRPLNMQPAGGGPDQNEQGGQPGKGIPKPPKPNDANDAETSAFEDAKKADLDLYAEQGKKGAKAGAALASFVILLDEAVERIAAAEIKALSVRADRAAEDNRKWQLWLCGVYAKHAIYVKKTLAPIYKSWTTYAFGGNADASDDLDMTFERWAEQCVVSVMEDPLAKPGTDVPALLETWKTTRATELATKLKKELFNES